MTSFGGPAGVPSASRRRASFLASLVTGFERASDLLLQEAGFPVALRHEEAGSHG